MEERALSKSREGRGDENTKAEEKEHTVTLPQRPYGLKNQGATCYLNSVLQVLFMTTEIHDRLDPNVQTDRELRNIFEGLKDSTCGTENITATFGITNVNVQRDAAEYLEWILSRISPQASEVFQGELRLTAKCCKDHSINEVTNPFLYLPLSLKETNDSTDGVEILSSFESIFQTKSYNVGNKIYCKQCSTKIEAESGCEMVTCPQILTLLLKRFVLDDSNMTHVKSDCCVTVPAALHCMSKSYELYAMVNHAGGLSGGHYTATILSDEDNTWYEFDDAHVRKVNEQPFAKTKTYKSSTAYLLVYRRSQDIAKDPLFIFSLIVVVCVLIVILCVTL